MRKKQFRRKKSKRCKQNGRQNKQRKTEFKTSKTKVYTVRRNLDISMGTVTFTSLFAAHQVEIQLVGGTPLHKGVLITEWAQNIRQQIIGS